MQALAPTVCETQHDHKLVCRCLRVTEGQVMHAVCIEEARTVRDIARCTGAGSGCTACHRRLARFVEGCD